MKKNQINKLISQGILIKKYPENAQPKSLNSFVYKGARYGWHCSLGFYIKIE